MHKDFSYRFVHHDLILFLGDKLMTSFHSLVDPLLKWLAHHCVDDISNIVSWKSISLPLLLWKRIHQYREQPAKIKHGLQFQTLEIRDGDYLDIFLLDAVPLS